MIVEFSSGTPMKGMSKTQHKWDINRNQGVKNCGSGEAKFLRIRNEVGIQRK